MKFKRMFGSLSFALVIIVGCGFSNIGVKAASLSNEASKKPIDTRALAEYIKNNPTKDRIIVNEYQLYKEMDKSTESPNSSSLFNYSDKLTNDGPAVRKYKETINGLKNKSEKELQQKGYSKERINAIKNFSGGEAQLMAIGGSLSLDHLVQQFDHDVYNYSSHFTKTCFASQMVWQWVSSPITNATDAIAVAWKASNGNLICNEQYIDSEIYYSLSGWHDYSSAARAGIKVNDNAVTHKFPLELNVPEMSDSAQWGYMYVELFNTDLYSSSIQVSWAYGHSRLGISPSFSISTSRSISFGLTVNVDTTQNNKTYYYSDFH